MIFTCEMFHPNIYPDGRVCISILHAPGDDPTGYETSAERWSPVQSVEKILLSVVSMLAGEWSSFLSLHPSGASCGSCEHPRWVSESTVQVTIAFFFRAK